MDNFLRDKVIIEEYVLFNVPADQIVVDPTLAEAFLQRVNRRLPDESKFTQADLNKRLINLRRRGQANGGLPRLRRNYSGRNYSPN
ncbi:hypothetical protein Mal35_57730 [Gimesia maris]|uniref:hypothetical protein n=1 Tax=Gimesia maris TaxID=122 RepID=UPI0011879DEA|nr:hypothetical protein [Gimesia maris]QDT82280.1 hypothetical protein Mal35_57730 [Gimesia maris]